MKVKDVNKLNQQHKSKTIEKLYKYCPKCNQKEYISCYVSKCPICKTKFEYCEQPKTQSQYQPKCPTCGSPNVRKISDLRKGIHAVAWGLLSTTAKCQYECENCSYKW